MRGVSVTARLRTVDDHVGLLHGGHAADRAVAGSIRPGARPRLFSTDTGSNDRPAPSARDLDVTARRLLVAGALLGLLLIPRAIWLYTDWLWFVETGYDPIFVRSLLTRLALGLGSFFVVFAFLYANARIALRAFARPFLIETGTGPVLVVDRSRTLPFIMVGAGVVALLAASTVSGQWLKLLYFLHMVPFGSLDETLSRDVGFYVFRLPFLELLRGLLLVLLGLSLVAATGLHVLTGGLHVSESEGLTVSRLANRHLSFLAAGLFALGSFWSWIEIPRVMLSPSGIIHGASYVDVAARLPILYAKIVVSLIGAGLFVAQAYTARRWQIAAALGAFVVVHVGGSAYATALQQLVVTPNEQVKEAPFIARNIAATRKAYALDAVEDRELSGDALLTRDDIDRNADTIRNVRLWDHKPLLDTFGQIQEIRTYYDFVSVDNDRYVVDGEYRQIMLSARELNSESLPNRSWPNERLTFTHGYGLALGPVNQVTPEGLPVLFIKNLPLESAVDLQVTEPSIYFGELSSNHVFVKTRTKEFHYPQGDDNVYTEYTGEGGVSVAGWLRKLLYSVRLGSYNLLFSGEILPESRILFNRRISDRVRAIAPFLTYDGDPYLVISEGRLFWIQDAYTVSNHYPASTPIQGGINYIRNSAKVVIDAYHGTTTYYLADPEDPIAASLGRIFPELFRPLANMPPDLKSHLRYPEGIFSVQAAMYSTYHMTNPSVFYNKEDQWEVPTLDQGSASPSPIQPYYTMMKLPGEETTEFIQILPFTPRGKDNLAAWMVARSDSNHYGKIRVFQFPKQKLVYGPRQIMARIAQDQVISPQITLWNQQGSEVIHGTLLAIPIEESLLYIRPLYLRGTGGRIAELKRVIVAYQNQIVMEDTLDKALDRIFEPSAVVVSDQVVEGDTPDAKRAEASPTPLRTEGATEAATTRARQARSHYDQATEAQRAGDWARYGEEIEKLGELLEEMANGP